MDSNIVNNETVRLAYQLAGFTHRPVEQVIMAAVREAAEKLMPQTQIQRFHQDSPLERLVQPVYDWRTPDDMLYDDQGIPKTDKPLSERLVDVQKFYASFPLLDKRSDEEILGYDENGLPH
ncbi:MAG: type II toxin-antitoxin system VapB family antitoxin [Alphaproteobacteria bacterium]|nr:type II toxin-antitoxin system VapB family antitoxin [Alphaproteobacteria bacterium]